MRIAMTRFSICRVSCQITTNVSQCFHFSVCLVYRDVLWLEVHQFAQCTTYVHPEPRHRCNRRTHTHMTYRYTICVLSVHVSTRENRMREGSRSRTRTRTRSTDANAFLFFFFFSFSFFVECGIHSSRRNDSIASRAAKPILNGNLKL